METVQENAAGDWAQAKLGAKTPRVGHLRVCLAGLSPLLFSRRLGGNK